MCLLLQKRWKPLVSPTYSGLLEIPAGGVNTFEQVFAAVKREVLEETGLRVTHIANAELVISEENNQEHHIAFQPYICQQTLKTQDGLPWIGFVFLCQAEGEPLKKSSEAVEIAWTKLEDIQEKITHHSDQFFPLQIPVLKYYLSQHSLL